jgi:hypothetical protein
MRGGGYESLPSKIYFVERIGHFYGPYIKRPTLVLKDGGTLVTLVRDTAGNYIKEG